MVSEFNAREMKILANKNFTEKSIVAEREDLKERIERSASVECRETLTLSKPIYSENKKWLEELGFRVKEKWTHGYSEDTCKTRISWEF